jgi:hypothetical protein
MATAAQLKALDDYRAARADLAKADHDRLEAMTDAADAQDRLDAELAAGDKAAADAARAALKRATEAAGQAAKAADKARSGIAGARKRALAGGGFDLLSAKHPLLLLPVRLETRFAWPDAGGRRAFSPVAGTPRSLLVRVHPDDVHDDTHEPELTAAEVRVLLRLEKRLRLATDHKHLDDAWSEAIRAVGPTRAAWYGEVLGRGAPPGRRPTRPSRPSVARLLPDRWTAFVELTDGSTLTADSGQVREPLETGPSPAGMDWMIDFDAGLKAGMALVVPGLPDPPVQVRRLVVLGVRGTLDPDGTAAELERLLDAQHYTRGCGFVAQGTPTNSLPGTRAGYTARPDLTELLPIERRRFLIGWRPSPLCRPHDGSGAADLADALGIRVDPFAYVARADATEAQIGRDVRLLLAEVVRRHLTRLLTGVVAPDHIAEILGVAIDLVTATGPFPALRVGSQPYGVLPVLLRDDARLPQDSLVARLLRVMDALRTRWDQAAATLPKVGTQGADPAYTLVRILQRDAVARRVGFRPMVGPELAAEVVAGLGPRRDVVQARARAAQAVDSLDPLGATHSAGSPLLEAFHLDFAAPLAVPVVEPPDVPAASPQRAATYLELAAATWPDKLLLHDYGGAERPRALLFAIARLAMLERADALARALHLQSGADPALWDAEDVPSPARDYLGTPQRRLEYPDPLGAGGNVAFQLSELGREAGASADLRAALRRLAAAPPDEVELHLRASLGLLGHRLDPWYTALATDRLRELRNDAASMTGLAVGAYGVLEDLRPSPRQPVPGAPGLYTSPVNGGYVHAPSAGHGAAAAVLRSVHLAHAAAGHGTGGPGKADAFSVDLSSARVRRGVAILEGIRAGQPLAALLGYRIERELVREGLQPLIARLRAAAPLVAHQLTPGTQPAESVAATNVVDGLRLLELAGNDGAVAPTTAALLAAAPGVGPVKRAEVAGLDRVLVAAADALDSVADLAVAESVYQAVQGSPTRSGAAVDALSGAPVPPPEIGVARTPRTGVGVTHRLLVLLGAAPAGGTAWAAPPRALAEPRLEAWARAALPPPASIRLRARFVDAEGAVVAVLDTPTLADLLAAAGPGLGLSALDLVLLADPHETPHRSPLELRLAAMLEARRPAGAGDATLELVTERAAGWSAAEFGLVETLEIARALRAAISRGRPLRPADLAPAAGGTAQATVEEVDLAGRATNATTALDGAISGLVAARAADDAAVQAGSADPAALRAALFAADRFGVPGAAPATVRDTAGTDDEAAAQRAREHDGLRHQVTAALAELRRRRTAVGGLPAADATGRLRAVFGEAFVVLPVLAPDAFVLAPFAAAAAPSGATPAQARAWLGRAAPVRESVGGLDAVLGHADALAAVVPGAPVPALHVGQLGGVTGERWVALPAAAGTRIPGGRVSFVAVTPGADLPAAAPGGLFVDEWLEVVPAAEETTSVSFHYDAPTAAAPQAWLLGVPPLGFEKWTAADARRVVDEALALARLRLVDTDDVPDLGQLLPAFVTAENPAGDTIGLDVEVLTGEQA